MSFVARSLESRVCGVCVCGLWVCVVRCVCVEGVWSVCVCGEVCVEWWQGFGECGAVLKSDLRCLSESFWSFGENRAVNENTSNHPALHALDVR